jgi:HD-GYP domain-containing protein (c-di-GMP phosphodiesterase class II)
MQGSDELLHKLEKLTDIGIALSAEKNTQRLLEMILQGAISLTNADGGTLYSVDEDGTVRMEIVRTKSLHYEMGGTTGKKIPFAPLSRWDKHGNANDNMVVTYAINNDCTVNIPDAYHASGFDFSGTKKFDETTGYHSQSFLTVPMKNHEGDITGVLQLINAQDPDTQQIIPFSHDSQKLSESLSSLAAIAISKRQLINDLNTLLESLIQLIATAIDDKSPYTGGHCRRVPELTKLIAQAAVESTDTAFRDFSLDEDEQYELSIAAWLHDCGKITTPEYIVDKATKLQTIFDRMELVKVKFEIAKRDARIAMLEAQVGQLHAGKYDSSTRLQQQYQQTIDQLEEDLAFLETSNKGGEFMNDADIKRIQQIARQSITLNNRQTSLLSDDELTNLSISKGTLTDDERLIINNHIIASIKMLDSLPFPKQLKHVPEYAGSHHERYDGKGYPQGLKGEQMSLQARMIALADIFEALTADDRPYKSGKKLTEAVYLLGIMKNEGHIDPDLFNLFIDQKLYTRYATLFLKEALSDEVDVTQIPGYITPDARV